MQWEICATSQSRSLPWGAWLELRLLGVENGSDDMYFYRRLRDLRRDADMDQVDVAKLLGMSQQQYSCYERGEREIPVHLLIKLADFYHTSLDYLIGRTNTK